MLHSVTGKCLDGIEGQFNTLGPSGLLNRFPDRGRSHGIQEIVSSHSETRRRLAIRKVTVGASKHLKAFHISTVDEQFQVTRDALFDCPLGASKNPSLLIKLES